MEKRIKFYEMEPGHTYQMVVMVTGMTDRGFSSKGEPYVTVDVFDGVKAVKINFWNSTVIQLERKGVKKETLLKMRIQVTSREKGRAVYYNVEDNGWEINADPSITKVDFVHAAPINPNDTFEWLLSRVQDLDVKGAQPATNKNIVNLTLQLLKDNKEAFIRSSAAVTMHHNFLHGLLYHTARMVLSALALCKVYAFLDKELLVCGAALHDIGKIRCYETMDVGESEVTVEGRLLDHGIVGIMMIQEAVSRNTGLAYDSEKILMLEHMIASHHGKKEWDAITTPAFPEAEMLHHIDMIDSRMNMFEEAYKGQAPETISNEKIFGLENSYIYKSSFVKI